MSSKSSSARPISANKQRPISANKDRPSASLANAARSPELRPPSPSISQSLRPKSANVPPLSTEIFVRIQSPSHAKLNDGSIPSPTAISSPSIQGLKRTMGTLTALPLASPGSMLSGLTEALNKRPLTPSSPSPIISSNPSSPIISGGGFSPLSSPLALNRPSTAPGGRRFPVSSPLSSPIPSSSSPSSISAIFPPIIPQSSADAEKSFQKGISEVNTLFDSFHKLNSSKPSSSSSSSSPSSSSSSSFPGKLPSDEKNSRPSSALSQPKPRPMTAKERVRQKIESAKHDPIELSRINQLAAEKEENDFFLLRSGSSMSMNNSNGVPFVDKILENKRAAENAKPGEKIEAIRQMTALHQAKVSEVLQRVTEMREEDYERRMLRARMLEEKLTQAEWMRAALPRMKLLETMAQKWSLVATFASRFRVWSTQVVMAREIRTLVQKQSVAMEVIRRAIVSYVKRRRQQKLQKAINLLTRFIPSMRRWVRRLRRDRAVNLIRQSLIDLNKSGMIQRQVKLFRAKVISAQKMARKVLARKAVYMIPLLTQYDAMEDMIMNDRIRAKAEANAEMVAHHNSHHESAAMSRANSVAPAAAAAASSVPSQSSKPAAPGKKGAAPAAAKKPAATPAPSSAAPAPTPSSYATPAKPKKLESRIPLDPPKPLVAKDVVEFTRTFFDIRFQMLADDFVRRKLEHEQNLVQWQHDYEDYKLKLESRQRMEAARSVLSSGGNADKHESFDDIKEPKLPHLRLLLQRSAMRAMVEEGLKQTRAILEEELEKNAGNSSNDAEIKKMIQFVEQRREEGFKFGKRLGEGKHSIIFEMFAVAASNRKRGVGSRRV